MTGRGRRSGADSTGHLPTAGGILVSGPTTAPGTTAPAPDPAPPAQRHGRSAGGLVLAAIGIVFGDIGTSPLYALQTVFSIDDGAVRARPWATSTASSR